MNANEHTLTRFYTAFAALDADTMASCYAANATFEDPAFSLKGRREISGMWHMLCAATLAKNREDWRLEFRDVRADHSSGHLHWEAHYRFSVSNRLVHNRIEADFTFTPDGLIASHTDRFDFWRWSRQALGLGGWVLGWAPFFQKQVRLQTHAALNKYLGSQP
ncbi:MAG: nuclear transport factor 2 family protein [Rhodoferax sp.]|uniref:nuclear transport factor 2 family protein n=1 Tax=Rhodoferax sp. TaxID=50421 RepID=UPI002736FE2C|nr:nuclear transport factor 2 family protein [Rhodoferax sp.]MDP2677748.1 nuclear transport factor 2 family protein [Rhodoferax sp.]